MAKMRDEINKTLGGIDNNFNELMVTLFRDKWFVRLFIINIISIALSYLSLYSFVQRIVFLIAVSSVYLSGYLHGLKFDELNKIIVKGGN